MAKTMEELQPQLDALREQGFYCFISNIAHSTERGKPMLLTPAGEWAVSFMRIGEVYPQPDIIRTDLMVAIEEAIEKKNKELEQAKNLSEGEAS